MGDQGLPQPDLTRLAHLREVGVIIAAAMKSISDIESQSALMRERQAQAVQPVDFIQRFKATYTALHRAIQELDRGGQ